MASLNYLLSIPGFGTGLECIQGTGYLSAGLPVLPHPFIWEYQYDRNLPCNDKNAWLPAVDIVWLQHETDPGLVENLVNLGKLAISTFVFDSPLAFVSYYQNSVALQNQQAAVAAAAEAGTEQIQAQYTAQHPYTEAPMDEFGDIFSGIGDFFTDFSVSDYLPSSDTFSSLAQITAPILSATLAQPTAYPVAQRPTGGTVYPVAGVPSVQQRAVMAGLPRWAASFPNLWQYVRTKFPTMSAASAVSGLLSLLSKYGPTALVSMLGSAVVGELLTYKVTKKRRRMNVANTRALRRSVRRLKGFNRLSHKVAAQLGRAGVRRRSGRCTTCRKSPCSC